MTRFYFILILAWLAASCGTDPERAADSVVAADADVEDARVEDSTAEDTVPQDPVSGSDVPEPSDVLDAPGDPEPADVLEPLDADDPDTFADGRDSDEVPLDSEALCPTAVVLCRNVSFGEEEFAAAICIIPAVRVECTLEYSYSDTGEIVEWTAEVESMTPGATGEMLWTSDTRFEFVVEGITAGVQIHGRVRAEPGGWSCTRDTARARTGDCLDEEP